ncbi:la-related protein 7 [Synchiropus splendidus]|uniref:la-related protein 7 n=1 Tax=Synchiropus splendidus TaxID=270530 RepID=UPI00237E5205|nr:la-related protein 7 [Synchiropus splendidus]
MNDSESGATESGTHSVKKEDTEKKKRSRVKQLLGDVKKQVEFWFGDVNLHKDRFMRQLIEDSGDGYVDLSVLASFNRMKKLTSDTKLIARALKNSSVVEVNLEGNKVRRQFPIGEKPEDVDSRTVYVELLPRDVNHSWMERVFTKCGNVVYISIPRYRSTGDPKGFAFVEFETVEQAQKAIEMLNNPPEDAPRKPGIFPKTKGWKPIPLQADNPPPAEEEEKKKKKKKKKKDGAAAQEVKQKQEDSKLPEQKTVVTAKGEKDMDVKVASKSTEKKRRRSQAAVDSEGEAPRKMRKTDESDAAEKTDSHDDGKENGDDSTLKAKRKRNKKHKEKLKIGEEVIPLRVLSKEAWLRLKDEYLNLQRSSMASLKKCITKINDTKQDESHGAADLTLGEPPQKQGPQFTSGVILKIADSKPLPSKMVIKDCLSKISPVAYVDVLDGDLDGHVRFSTPDQAAAVIKASSKMKEQHSWKMEILSGDHEQRYWQKILVDRQVKLNRPREKRRGTEKLISKAEKIIVARASESCKHIRFSED